MTRSRSPRRWPTLVTGCRWIAGQPTGYLAHKGVLDSSTGHLYLTLSDTGGPYDGGKGRIRMELVPRGPAVGGAAGRGNLPATHAMGAAGVLPVANGGEGPVDHGASR